MSTKKEGVDLGIIILTGAALAAGIAYVKGSGKPDIMPPPPKVQPQASASQFPIRKGDRGDHVRRMQQALQSMGGMIQMYIDGSGGADGIYGPGTEKALAQAMFPKIVTAATFQKIIAGSKPTTAGSQATYAVTKARAPIFKIPGKNWMGIWEGTGKITTLPATTAAGRLVGSKLGNFILVESNINNRNYRYWIGESQVDLMPETVYKGLYSTGDILKMTPANAESIVGFYK
jgi:hypothetical protein